MLRRILFYSLIAVILFCPVFRVFASNEITERAAGARKIEFAGREYFNYQFLLNEAGEASLPTLGIDDILLEPNPLNEFILHPDLLKHMYENNMQRVFFVTELSPYYPSQKYDRIPWGRNESYTYFGNAFWRSQSKINSIYRDVYGNSAKDYNSNLKRVEDYRGMKDKPKVFVFARLHRTGANSQWRNAWGWRYYYYFEGEEIFMP
jgi:hypothetical protein